MADNNAAKRKPKKAQNRSPGKPAGKATGKPSGNAGGKAPGKYVRIKMTPEEEIKHIPKAIVEEHFISGHFKKPHRTAGQKAADWTTRWVGSWTFIILLFVFMAIWMTINLYMVFSLNWDPYPFILLNFVLSCLAAIQAPIILMSENRQTEMDRMKAERDFAVNRKSEKEIEVMQHDLEVIKNMIRKLKAK